MGYWDSMHPNEETLARFYASFASLDPEAMAQCYHEDVEFCDPVFPMLRGDQVSAMWTMLCRQAQGFELSFGDIQADDKEGKAKWQARYNFGPSARAVHNRIEASFRFQDGKIISHVDDFSFWRWSVMALGPAGVMLGWTPFLRRKVRAQAARSLEKFMAKAEA